MAFGVASASGTSTIDFEGLTEGQMVSSVSSGSGISGATVSGSVSVFGLRPGFGPNQAMIFDATCTPGGTASDCTGGDTDLLFPAPGNVLIVSEDNQSADPDDADLVGELFDFDFAGFGPGVVTVDSIDALDIEAGQGEGGAKIDVYSGGLGGTLLTSVGIPDTSNPAIDIEKATLVIPAPVDGDACDTLGKPVILTMTYTGDAIPTSHSQADGKVTIIGTTGNAPLVHIIATDKSDPDNGKAKSGLKARCAGRHLRH